MPTLYLSDLDGTLLRSDQRTSDYTNDTINRLVSDGMVFSYATARSFNTARKVTAGLDAKIPLIVYNGAFIVDNMSHERLAVNLFTEAEAEMILEALLAADIAPIVYCLDDKERFVYNCCKINTATKEYVDSRHGDSRDTPVENDRELTRQGAFYFTCIDDAEKLEQLYAKFAEAFEKDYVNQGFEKDRTIEETLELGWKLLKILPTSELKRIRKEYIDKYMTDGEDDGKA